MATKPTLNKHNNLQVSDRAVRPSAGSRLVNKIHAETMETNALHGPEQSRRFRGM